MSSHPFPIALSLAENGDLLIDWSDKIQHHYPPRMLRDASPDALTREKNEAKANQPANALNILEPGETQPITIRQMNPIGNYAYQIVFSDGHDTGIFTFEYLRALGEAIAERT